MPTNPDGPSSYGGFKALSEATMLARHAASGFPAVVVRPAAIYGPDNNIYDMETPMFLRLLQHRPILVPHGGLVVGSYGHVDDLCAAMVLMAQQPAARGEVFNLTGESLDVNRYIRTLAGIVGEPPEVVYIPDPVLDELNQAGALPVYSHLFKVRHHAMITTEKVERMLGWRPRYDVVEGHRQTFAWFRVKGWDRLQDALGDPVWKSSWDFAAEAALADRLRHA
jgi:nucleoside-diphosphate-sugar epimerase